MNKKNESEKQIKNLGKKKKRKKLNQIIISALVAQWFTRLSLDQEVLGSRPEVDTGGALVVWPGDVDPEQTRLW